MNNNLASDIRQAQNLKPAFFMETPNIKAETQKDQNANLKHQILNNKIKNLLCWFLYS